MPDDESQSSSAAMPHVEDVNAPVIYADWCWGGGPMNGDNITLTFVAKLLNHAQTPPSNVTKTVLRLVIPKVGAAAMAEFTQKLLSDLASGENKPMTNTKLN